MHKTIQDYAGVKPTEWVLHGIRSSYKRSLYVWHELYNFMAVCINRIYQLPKYLHKLLHHYTIYPVVISYLYNINRWMDINIQYVESYYAKLMELPFLQSLIRYINYDGNGRNSDNNNKANIDDIWQQQQQDKQGQQEDNINTYVNMFFDIVAKPDNMIIVALVGIFLYMSMILNDRRRRRRGREEGGRVAENVIQQPPQ